MSVFDKIYRCIGENDMRVSHKKFEWSFKTTRHQFNIECIDCHYLTSVRQIEGIDNGMHVEMVDGDVIAYKCSEVMMKKISTKVNDFLKDVKNKVPDKINLCIDGEWVRISHGKVIGTNDLDIYKKCKKIVKELESSK
jgi:hypothetical protein